MLPTTQHAPEQAPQDPQRGQTPKPKKGNWGLGVTLLALLVVVAIVALSALGGTVSGNFNSVDSALTGNGSGPGIAQSAAPAGDAEQTIPPASQPPAIQPPAPQPPTTQAPATTDAPAADTATDDDTANSEGLFGTLDPVEVEEEAAVIETGADARFTDYGIRTFIDTRSDPLSTFSLDVDTGSYTVGRNFIEQGQLPPRESVRVEEYVNFFDYNYEAPQDGLGVSVDGGPSPFNDDTWLLRVGTKAAEVEAGERQRVALTFVVDTSGSMDTPERLGLVKESLSLLVNELNDDDTVAIVTYSGNAGIILEPTKIRNSFEILQAIDGMRAGGSTNLQSGLDTGYALARDAFREDGINRVIVASDGIANAGVTNADALASRLRGHADQGIGLVTVGYGLDGFNDTTMEQIADQSDGFYAYVDTITEAQRLFSRDLTSTLITEAIDAKIQLEFDEDLVSEYRLIGYENRVVADEDFRNDSVDAGELGSGHEATAIYEVRLNEKVDINDQGELGNVSLRWEDPDTREVTEIAVGIAMTDLEANWSETSVGFRQATVVAAFAEVLRDNPYADQVSLTSLSQEANSLAREIDSPDFSAFAELIGNVNLQPEALAFAD